MGRPPVETLKRIGEEEDGPRAALGEAGLVLIWSGGRPVLTVLPLEQGAVELGRECALPELGLDSLISRKHARVSRQEGQLVVCDLGSRNGTRVDGELLPVGQTRRIERCFRIGDSVFAVVPNVSVFGVLGVMQDAGHVYGPAMQAVLAAVHRAARHGDTLHITGESGTGKERVARAFHSARPTDKGSFIAVNCATIPEGIAERLLFGTKRGAFSGADADADGYVQSADGGTLFLDEIGDLHVAVQAKLLRVLESREVLPVGATRSRAVRLHVCSATHKDLRAQVAAGRLREDLYFRIARPAVEVPPLRKRPEELPFLILRAVQAITKDLIVRASFIETCVVRAWPGNIRELMGEVRTAVQIALESGNLLDARHLCGSAGSTFRDTPAQLTVTPSPSAQSLPSGPRADRATFDRAAPERATIERALGQCGGNVSAAARLLQVHRTQLYRWMTRYGLDPGAKPGS
jgi:DNA-binding NtrC family response regulator